jgi:non-heme chloroperoxidase
MMQRRNALKAAASLLAGAGILVAGKQQAHAEPGPRAGAGRSRFPFLETGDRTTLFYKDWGAGKPVVVFVHGWPLHADMWQYQMIALAEAGLRVIAYDQRGCGRSTDPGTGFDYDILADDLASVLKQLDLRGVVLVGHSMGAGQIVRYLSRHGAARVSRIVLLSASLPFIQAGADNPDGVDAAHFERLRTHIRTDTPQWLGAASLIFAPATSPEMREWGARMCQQNSVRALIETNHADVETDFRAELPKLAVPSLVVHGDADRTCPIDLTGRRLAQLIPGAELKVYEGAPHGLFITHMERLNRDLRDFAQG